MNRRRINQLTEQLSTRDQQILASLERFRLLDTGLLMRLHFTTDHATDQAVARACNRALRRLNELGVISSLKRRIGGVRRGSASYVWQLAAPGEGYLRTVHGRARRKRYLEPGALFVNHTLAVNELAVALIEADRELHHFTVEELVTEPGNWRRYLGPAGETKWLKPDLHVVTTISKSAEADPDDGYEEHAFVEIDLGTEHLPRIQAKCSAYATFAATGAYQAAHGLFPAVVWVSADKARRAALRAAVAATPRLPAGLCQVTSPEGYMAGATSPSVDK